MVTSSTMTSSLPSGENKSISKTFNVTNDVEQGLPISVFLVGYTFGPVAFGPLSETYGRKIILLSTFSLFIAFTLGCALAPNWPSFLIFRFLSGINGSAPLAVLSGVFTDCYGNIVYRGWAMCFFITVIRGF